MKLPRDVSGEQLVKKLERLGYRVTRRQEPCPLNLRNSHTASRYHTNHNPLRLGTLSGILGDVAAHLKIPREELVRKLFG